MTGRDTRGADASGGAGAGRIAGLDLARAGALIGMFAAHIGAGYGAGLTEDGPGRGWLWIVDGRSSALFAVLAGVTISIMVRRDTRGPCHAAIRIVIRGLVLIALGYALDRLGTPVDVVLANLGLMFILVAPVVKARTPWLVGGAATLWVVGGLAYQHVEGALDGIPVAEKLTSIDYPAIAWTGYVLAGMALGRMIARPSIFPWRIARIGAGLALLGYGGAAACGASAPWLWNLGPSWSSIEPHSYTPFELLGNTGVALLIIGLCVAISPRGPAWGPALAFGSMSLTMYVAHVIVIWRAGWGIVYEPRNAYLASLTVGLMAFAYVWRRYLGAGPLERGLTWISSRGADALTATRVGAHG